MTPWKSFSALVDDGVSSAEHWFDHASASLLDCTTRNSCIGGKGKPISGGFYPPPIRRELPQPHAQEDACSSAESDTTLPPSHLLSPGRGPSNGLNSGMLEDDHDPKIPDRRGSHCSVTSENNILTDRHGHAIIMDMAPSPHELPNKLVKTIQNLVSKDPYVSRQVNEMASTSLRFMFLKQCGNGNVENCAEIWSVLDERDRMDFMRVFQMGPHCHDRFFCNFLEPDVPHQSDYAPSSFSAC